MDRENFFEEEQNSEDRKIGVDQEEDLGRAYSSEQSADMPENSEELNDLEYFLKLTAALRQSVEVARRVPFTNMVMIDPDMFLAILDDLDRNYQPAIQQGKFMYSDRERIMGNAERTAMAKVVDADNAAKATRDSAQRDAERIIAEADEEARIIVEDAKARAAHLVSEDEIVQRAREEARRIRSNAKTEADELHLKVSHEMHKLLTETEDDLADALNAVRRGRKQLEEQQG